MKKNIPTILLALALFTGCGGGASDTGDDPIGGDDTTIIATPDKKTVVKNKSGKTDGKYNLWEYIIPSTDTTNIFIETTGSETNSYKTTYTTSGDSVLEVSDYASNEKTTYTKKSDRITITFTKDGTQNGSYDLDLTADIGDVVTVEDSTCKLKKYHSTITIGNKNFKDTIEINCNGKPGYYAKGVGEVAQIEELSENGSRSIRVLSN